MDLAKVSELLESVRRKALEMDLEYGEVVSVGEGLVIYQVKNYGYYRSTHTGKNNKKS